MDPFARLPSIITGTGLTGLLDLGLLLWGVIDFGTFVGIIVVLAVLVIILTLAYVGIPIAVELAGEIPAEEGIED